MSFNLFALVFGSQDPFQEDDLVRLREEVQTGEDHTVIGIDLHLAARHGIEIDPNGMPSASSLEAWHRKNNPHLFE